MNKLDRLFGMRGEARLHYGDGEYKVVATGEFVRCTVTGQPIPLTELRYWSVQRQEAYASAAISLQRYLDLKANSSVDS